MYVHCYFEAPVECVAAMRTVAAVDACIVEQVMYLRGVYFPIVDIKCCSGRVRCMHEHRSALMNMQKQVMCKARVLL